MFRLNERMQDSQEQVRTQDNALELLEVAMWVALTQYQVGNIRHMRRRGVQRWSPSWRGLRE